MTVDTQLDWAPIRALARNVLRDGAPLLLTDEVRHLLRRTAQEVGLAEAAVDTHDGALAVLRECSRRITEGSHRLGDALHRMYRHRESGDYDSARQELRAVLAVEVVPLYREIAQGQLDDMAAEP